MRYFFFVFAMFFAAGAFCADDVKTAYKEGKKFTAKKSKGKK